MTYRDFCDQVMGGLMPRRTAGSRDSDSPNPGNGNGKPPKRTPWDGGNLPALLTLFKTPSQTLNRGAQQHHDMKPNAHKRLASMAMPWPLH